MKGVICDIPERLLEWRSSTGADRWDEMWIIDRGIEKPQIHVLRGEDYAQQSADAQGWLQSPLTYVRLRQDPSEKLAVRLGDDPQTDRLLP
jgi:hypothetical protein